LARAVRTAATGKSSCRGAAKVIVAEHSAEGKTLTRLLLDPIEQDLPDRLARAIERLKADE
jgi:hypothetical protein